MMKLLSAITAACVAVASPATAQSFPSKPIRIVVPTSAGGPGDFMARVVGEYITEKTGAAVVPEYKAGASGKIAMRETASAPPDGYTIVNANVGSAAINMGYFANNGYDTEKDLEPISYTMIAPIILVVNKDLPVNNAKELADYIKANPGKVKFGSSGIGQSPHLAAEIYRKIAGINFTLVPYQGAAPAVRDLLGGQIEAMFDSTTSIPHIQAGSVKLIAVATPKRSPLFPNTPTVGESGLPDMNVGSWWVLFAPKGTPKPIIDRLATLASEAVQSPKGSERIKSLNSQPIGTTPEEAKKFVAEQVKYWKDTLPAYGIKGVD